MPAAHKRKLIEAKLGESLEMFLSKQIAAGQDVKSIARELNLAPATIRYYVKKYKFPRPAARPRESVSLHTTDTKPSRLLLKGEHVDVCLCPLWVGLAVPSLLVLALASRTAAELEVI